jgi:hypothetical protein
MLQLLTKAHESEDGTGPESDLLDVLRLVRECVGMKNVQLSARALCYQALIDQGVLTLLPRAFLHTDPAFANLATEACCFVSCINMLLVSMIAMAVIARAQVLSQMVSFDAKSVRTHMLQEWKVCFIYQHERDHDMRLTILLCTLFSW